jgi:para-nitrobenzyl esterase
MEQAQGALSRDATRAEAFAAWLPQVEGLRARGRARPGSHLFDGSALAREEVVVVSLNYRLGRLGFFMHPSLRAMGEGAPGN